MRQPVSPEKAPPQTILGQQGADFPSIYRAMYLALGQGQGFSAIRLGDGEGVVLACDDPAVAPDLEEKRQTWFGPLALTAQDWAHIRAGLERSIAQSDVIGLPRPFQLEKHHRYRILLPQVEKILDGKTPMFTDNGLHFYLQWSGALGPLMKLADRITIIGCRDVADKISDTLGLPSLRSLLVRGEDKFPGTVDERHWPDGYARILAEIEDLGAGDLVLVGAGPLGKIYCAQAKARRAVAIDVGSLLDAWVSIPSRHLFSGPIQDLFSIETLLNAPASPEEARDRITAVVAGTRFADGIF